MGSFAVSGKTAILKRSTEFYPTPPATWEELGELVSIGDFVLEREVYTPVTNQDGELNPRAYVGVYKPISLDLKINLTSSSKSVSFYADVEESAPFPYWYRITYPVLQEAPVGQPYSEFAGPMTKFSISTPLDGLIQADITIKATTYAYIATI